MTKNLLLIFSPLQYLNALEFVENSHEEYRMINLTVDKVAIDQIAKIGKHHRCEFPLIHFQFLPDVLSWLMKLLYCKFCINTKNYQTLVLGNYNNISGYYLATRFAQKKKKIVLLDDGLATINSFLDRNEKHILANDKIFGGRFCHFYKQLFQLNARTRILELTFYTKYELDRRVKPIYDQIKFVPFNIIRRLDHRVEKRVVWFIGSPVVELNILQLQTYSEIIQKLKNQLEEENKTLIYVLHRREKEKFAGISYMRFDKPLEVIFEEHGRLPSQLVSFYSTALINIASSFIDIKCQYINLTKYNIYNENIVDVYKLFELHRNMSEFKFSKS